MLNNIEKYFLVLSCMTKSRKTNTKRKENSRAVSLSHHSIWLCHLSRHSHHSRSCQNPFFGLAPSPFGVDISFQDPVVPRRGLFWLCVEVSKWPKRFLYSLGNFLTHLIFAISSSSSTCICVQVILQHYWTPFRGRFPAATWINRANSYKLAQ